MQCENTVEIVVLRLVRGHDVITPQSVGNLRYYGVTVTVTYVDATFSDEVIQVLCKFYFSLRLCSPEKVHLHLVAVPLQVKVGNYDPALLEERSSEDDQQFVSTCASIHVIHVQFCTSHF